jgi:hypothetical protein
MPQDGRVVGDWWKGIHVKGAVVAWSEAVLRRNWCKQQRTWQNSIYVCVEWRHVPWRDTFEVQAYGYWLLAVLLLILIRHNWGQVIGQTGCPCFRTDGNLKGVLFIHMGRGHYFMWQLLVATSCRLTHRKNINPNAPLEASEMWQTIYVRLNQTQVKEITVETTKETRQALYVRT